MGTGHHRKEFRKLQLEHLLVSSILDSDDYTEINRRKLKREDYFIKRIDRYQSLDELIDSTHYKLYERQRGEADLSP